jgi:hypothetical protein
LKINSTKIPIVLANMGLIEKFVIRTYISNKSSSSAIILDAITKKYSSTLSFFLDLKILVLNKKLTEAATIKAITAAGIY